MGLFSKIKNNLNHGGVKVSLQAPSSVSMQDATLETIITVTNGEQLQTISRVSVEIQATSRNTSFNGTSNDTTQSSGMMHVMAHSENVEQFTLQPAESRAVPLTITMNSAAVVGAVLPQGDFAAEAVGALQKMQSVNEALNSESYTYSLYATADVTGIAIDPTAQQPLQILKPGEFGSALNIKL